MSVWKLIRLNFGANKAHFGESEGVGMESTAERIHSDTLFSALISSYARLYGSEDVANLLYNFPCDDNQKTPPFYLSSTFIYRLEDSKYIYYLPKPLKFPNKYPIQDDLEFAKAYKKLAYLPLDIWHRWYQTEEGFTKEDKEELIAHAKKKQSSSPKLKEAGTLSYDEAFKINRVPKVSIDRTTNAANIYYTGFVGYQSQPSQQSGLYFLLEFPGDNPELKSKLKACLSFLADEGIGGERSSGAGRFTLEWEALPEEWQQVIKPPLKVTPKHCSISLFWEEKLSPHSVISYSLLERGGWVSSSNSGHQARRKKVRMLGEGSIFIDIPRGQLADVKPYKDFPHPVYRSGISLSLPIIIGNEKS